MTFQQRMSVYDSIRACVGYLAERRTRGRFELLCAVQELNRLLCIHVLR